MEENGGNFRGGREVDNESIIGIIGLVVGFVAGYIYRDSEVRKSLVSIESNVKKSLNVLHAGMNELCDVLQFVHRKADKETKEYIDEKTKNILEKTLKAVKVLNG